ncbi:hypothetical protein ACFWGN_16195 [Oerskovia sp. NPDC060338]|uniref:hypothetical protein n=1 Tax=Oerskovia sp. NPDC060338 TaxID=3347100 RepID=UPI003658B74C
MNLTTLLDLLGSLLLVLALAVLLWPISPALALAAVGAGLLALSWLVDGGPRLRRWWAVRKGKR